MAYHGVKFKTSFIGESYPMSSHLEELSMWCNLFAERGLAPTHPEGTYGNLSVRFEDGIIITATSLNLGKKLVNSDFIFVQACNFKTYEISVYGKRAPSSETPIHWALYQMRPDINAIFHGHHESLLHLAGILQIPETEEEQPYGSPALVNEVKKLASKNFFNMKNHGFISMGISMQKAGDLALEQLEKLSKK